MLRLGFSTNPSQTCRGSERNWQDLPRKWEKTGEVAGG